MPEMRAYTMALMYVAAAGAFSPPIPTTSSPQLRSSPSGWFRSALHPLQPASLRVADDRGDAARMPALCSLRGGADAEATASADIRRNLEDVQTQVHPSTASPGLTDYSQADILGLRYDEVAVHICRLLSGKQSGLTLEIPESRSSCLDCGGSPSTHC
jgi:hypothetical protein